MARKAQVHGPTVSYSRNKKMKYSPVWMTLQTFIFPKDLKRNGNHFLFVYLEMTDADFNASPLSCGSV